MPTARSRAAHRPRRILRRGGGSCRTFGTAWFSEKLPVLIRYSCCRNVNAVLPKRMMVLFFKALRIPIAKGLWLGSVAGSPL